MQITDISIILTLLAVAYISYVLGMFFLQDRFIFPVHEVAKEMTIRTPLETEELNLHINDDLTLNGVLFKAKEAKAPVLIVFAGNAWNAVRQAEVISNQIPEAHVVGINYRGYGKSDGTPSEAAITADSVKVFDMVKERFPKNDLYIFGYSLGSGIATYTASEVADKKLKGVILAAPYDSMAATAQDKHPIVPVHLLIKHKIESYKFVQKISTPITVISGTEDQVVKPKRTARLIKNIPNLRAHNIIDDANHSEVVEKLIFYRYLRRAMNLEDK